MRRPLATSKNSCKVGEQSWSNVGRDKPSERTTTHSRDGLGFHYPRWTLRWPTTWLRLAAHYLLARPAMFLLGWPRVTGRENLRGIRGPLLVVSNHIADVDVGFIQTALPARIRHKLATATGGEALEALALARVHGRPCVRCESMIACSGRSASLC